MTPLELRPLLPSLQEKARKEINEEPNRIASDIIAVREWLEKQPHLTSVNPIISMETPSVSIFLHLVVIVLLWHSPGTIAALLMGSYFNKMNVKNTFHHELRDVAFMCFKKKGDQWIVAFLRGSKYSLEKTKSKLDLYYTLRSLVPEIFNNRNPFDPIVQGILKLGTVLPLAALAAEDSRRVCLHRFKDAENSNYRLIDVMKVAFMIVEILMLEDDNFMISGMEQIVDLSGVGMRTYSQWTPTVAKMSMTLTEKAYPMRMKGCHLLHTSTAFETAYSVLRMVMSEKFKKRFYVYSQNVEAIYEVIPRAILPKEYGGECGTVQELTDYWKTKVESYSEWFQREELICSDEALRPGAPETSSELFGAVGSFRKLEVD